MPPNAFIESIRARQAKAVHRSRDWFRVQNASEDVADLYIFDEISWFGINAADFTRELNAITAPLINLHLNTPGGDVFDGIAIMNALKAHPAAIHVTVDGIAASIGSVIAMAGDRIEMATHATLMIHDPWGVAIGDAADLRKTAGVLDQLGDTIAGVYAAKAGGSVREWRDRMLAETWYTDQGAVDAGLADGVVGQVAAANRFDLSIFANVPDRLRPSEPAEAGPSVTKRDAERALREVGLSQAHAKTVIATGWRDDEPQPTRDVLDWSVLRDAIAATIRA